MVVSNKIVVILAVLTIIISVISTYIIIGKANNVPTFSGPSQGQIGVYVVKQPAGQIGVNVVNPVESETEGEE